MLYDVALMTGEQSKIETQKRTPEPRQASWSSKLPGALFLSLHKIFLKTELVTGRLTTSTVPTNPTGLLTLHKYHSSLCVTVFYIVL